MTTLSKLRGNPPLIVCITNDVVKDITANGLLALGASPIMSGEKSEAAGLMQAADGLLINIGTADTHKKNLMFEMAEAANKNNVPLVLDPVGYAASDFRRNLVDELIEKYEFTLIKGNQSEMMALAGLESTSRGVDSTDAGDALEIAEAAFEALNIPALVTGETDAFVTRTRRYTLHNGNGLQGRITGSGCLLGAVMLAFISRSDGLTDGALDAVSYYNLCAESAAGQNPGPATFRTGFIDALYLNDASLLSGKDIRQHE
ncbi:hydroxyethylthiazole kinase [Salinicoccus kekensis]|uniref:Hydroxyethylthiazole kinase n=1 Tax=Salinicoccus kekensis TaxID=714307 RepID=A0A285UJT2_9STAP|nr:hydroxyethylthiazole kinase [Salinicoccus kekensis]SOC42150.1 hydroxyethylthiazole kinase [Salinicoccus kekensis]